MVYEIIQIDVRFYDKSELFLIKVQKDSRFFEVDSCSDLIVVSVLNFKSVYPLLTQVNCLFDRVGVHMTNYVRCLVYLCDKIRDNFRDNFFKDRL